VLIPEWALPKPHSAVPGNAQECAS
jgi:hypothetical protein